MSVDFETWCSNTWFEHKREVLAWTGKPVTEYTYEEWRRDNEEFLLKKFNSEEK